MIPWTFSRAVLWFLIAGRGSSSLDHNTISEGVIGGVLGVLLAMLFTFRAKRKYRRLTGPQANVDVHFTSILILRGALAKTLRLLE